MVVHLKPETEVRLKELAAETGRAPDELVEDAMAGYLAELAQVRTRLDGRYDEIKSGQVEVVDGEEAFKLLRKRSEDRRRQRTGLFFTPTQSRIWWRFGSLLPPTTRTLRIEFSRKSKPRFEHSFPSLNRVITGATLLRGR